MVGDYLNEFTEFMDEAGYIKSLSIVMKFRKGLDQNIQDHIVETEQGRLSDHDPEGWCSAAHFSC